MRSYVIALGLAVAGRASAAPKVCTVTGTKVTIQEVTVTPPGHEAFQLDFFETPVSTTLPTRCGAPLALTSTGALELTAQRSDVWLKLARDVTSTDGMIVAKRGARMIDACVRGDRVIAKAITYADDVLEGEPKRPGAFVADVEVPCDALTLDAMEYPGTSRSTDGTDHHWEVRDDAERIRLYARASLGSPSHAVIGESYLREIQSKRGWILVEVAGEGVAIRGWVPTSKIKRMPDDVGVARGSMCTGDHGHGTYGETRNPNAVDRTGVVRADARVYTSPGRGEWARFTAATPIKVRIIKGEPWAKLRVVPGVHGSPFMAGYIPVDTIQLDP